jgi:hypothetical protein
MREVDLTEKPDFIDVLIGSDLDLGLDLGDLL